MLLIVNILSSFKIIFLTKYVIIYIYNRMSWKFYSNLYMYFVLFTFYNKSWILNDFFIKKKKQQNKTIFVSQINFEN